MTTLTIPSKPLSINDALTDAGTSYWLKNALLSALDRDIVDAVNDAELLFELLSKKWQDEHC